MKFDPKLEGRDWFGQALEEHIDPCLASSQSGKEEIGSRRSEK